MTLFLMLLSFSLVNGEEEKVTLKEESIKSDHRVVINGKTIDYTAVVGNLVLKDKEEDQASFFYTAYFKKGEKEATKRPITYCFNGGPGSSSVWLHLGAFGPKIVDLKENGDVDPPYSLKSNEYSLLDVTDLVFIDPVSTGFSRVAKGKDPKDFHGVDKDIKSVAHFIRLFTTEYGRWESPKFLAGESYGTTRAAGLAAELHDEDFFYINGLLLVSSVLDFQTLIDFNQTNDLACILFLPTYATTAYYHKKLDEELQGKSLQDLIEEVTQFSLNEYALALLQGDTISEKSRKEVGKKLSHYTGLSESYIQKADLRVGAFQFRKELLAEKRRNVGRFDSRFVGIDLNPLSEKAMIDPSAEAVFGAFTATFNEYVREELGWKKREKYEVLTNVHPWDWNATNEYLNVSKALRDVMSKNKKLRVFVGNGYYDLATPFFATEYTFNHLNLDRSLRKNVEMGYYDAGHMMYIHKPSLIKLNDDIRSFINQTLGS